MSNDNPAEDLETLKAQHRALDAQIDALIAAAEIDQLEIARLKKRKLRLKDRIQQLIDASIPDISA